MSGERLLAVKADRGVMLYTMPATLVCCLPPPQSAPSVYAPRGYMKSVR